MDAQKTTRTSPLLLIITGIVIGILVTGALALVYSGLKNRKSRVNNEAQGLLLSITNPSDGDVVYDKNLSISGTSGKDAVVVVTGAHEDTISETSQGNFSIKVSLNEGENLLNIYAFDTTTGESVQLPIGILYIPQKVVEPNVSPDSSGGNTTNKTKEDLQALKEKIASTSSKTSTTSYKDSHVFGKVISKSNTTVELNTGDTIRTVFTDDLTKFLSLDKDGFKEIFLENVGVGDQISAVGLSADNAVGVASVIIKINKDISQGIATIGKVKKATDVLTLSYMNQTSQTISVKTASGTTILTKDGTKVTLAEIKTDDIVIVTGTVDKDNVLTASKILLIPGKPLATKPKTSSTSASPSTTP